MGRLILRAAGSVCAGLLALALVTALFAPQGEGPAPHAAAHYLEESWPRGPLEGGWTVRRIEPLPGRIRVVLGVDDTPAAGFLRMPDGARWLAFGPSCPPAGHPVWSRLEPEQDILLRPVSDSGEVIIEGLSCRDWHRLGPDPQSPSSTA